MGHNALNSNVLEQEGKSYATEMVKSEFAGFEN